MNKIKDPLGNSSEKLLNCNSNKFSSKKLSKRKLILPSQKIMEYLKVDKNILQDQINLKHNSQFIGFRDSELYSPFIQDEDSSSSIDYSIKLSSHKKSSILCSDSETNKSPTEDDSITNANPNVHSMRMNKNAEHPSISSSDSHSSTNLDKSSPNICSNKKNYKSLTRERRVEANARERSRVHTISAAFESLRHAVPGYSSSPKLSKLGILRIACCYIESLNQLLQTSDKIDPQFNSNFSKCIQKLAQTIAAESKLKNNASSPY